MGVHPNNIDTIDNDRFWHTPKCETWQPTSPFYLLLWPTGDPLTKQHPAQASGPAVSSTRHSTCHGCRLQPDHRPRATQLRFGNRYSVSCNDFQPMLFLWTSKSPAQSKRGLRGQTRVWLGNVAIKPVHMACSLIEFVIPTWNVSVQ